MAPSSMIYPSLLPIAEALKRAIGNGEQAIQAFYPQVLPSLNRSEPGEDLMGALGMAFIAPGNAYLTLAHSLISFLIVAVGEDQGKFYCPVRPRMGFCNLDAHFGLAHHHLDNFDRPHRLYSWDGYQAAALALNQEEARRETKKILAANGHDVAELEAGLPPLGSVDLYDASFIAVANDSAADRSPSRLANISQGMNISARIGDLIADQAAQMYTLVGGGDDEVILYGANDAYLRLAQGLVDFVMTAQNSRPNLPPDKPLLSRGLRNIFDVSYSFFPMDTVCLAETEAEFERAYRFFRVDSARPSTDAGLPEGGTGQATASAMAYRYVNAKGDAYYLHSREMKDKHGRDTMLYYFGLTAGKDALEAIPAGYQIAEARNGLPILRPAEENEPVENPPGTQAKEVRPRSFWDRLRGKG